MADKYPDIDCQFNTEADGRTFAAANPTKVASFGSFDDQEALLGKPGSKQDPAPIYDPATGA